MLKNFSKKLFIILMFQIFIFLPISAMAGCEWTDMGIVNGQKQYQYCDKVPGKAGWISSGSDKCSEAAPASMQYAECCCSNVDSSISGSNVNSSMPSWTIPNVKISIPGLAKFEDPKCTGSGENRTCEIDWIGKYMSAIFKYAIGVVGIIATVVLMIGGLVWLTSGGNQTRVGEAKAWIGASLTGLIIALTSYIILYQVNPDLVKFRPIIIGVVSEIEGDNNSKIITPNDINSLNIASGPIADVVKSMIGKFTYDQGKRLTSADGTTYIDCSSFACTVLTKSGYNSPDPSQCTTSGLFKNPSQGVSLDSMAPGTLVGFPPTASNNGSGHVWVSLGNGQFAQASGGKTGRTPGGAISIVDAKSVTSTMAKYDVKNTYLYP